MAEEMPVGLGVEPGRRPAVGGDGNTETSRPAGKGDPFVRAGAQRDVMAALGQLDRADIAALEREQRRGVAAAIVAARGGEQLHVVRGPGAIPRHGEKRGAACGTDEKLTAVDTHDQSPSMALKPKVRPAPREIMSPCRGGGGFQRDAQGFELAAQILVAHRFGDGLVHAAQDLDGVIEIEHDRILDAGRTPDAPLARTRLWRTGRARRQDCLPCWRSSARSARRAQAAALPARAWPERLCQFLVAHPFDAGGEGLEQLERHLFRRVIGSVGWTGLEIGLGVGRAILPAVNDLLGYACEIAGDGFGKAAAERPFGAAFSSVAAPSP